MRRKTTAGAAILGMLAVTAGAFGAHALRAHVTPERLDTFQVAARHQLVHAVLLVAIGLVGDRLRGRLADIAIGSIFAGIALFSGSLYVLVLSGQRYWGAVTPVGGVLFHVGWFCIFLAALRSRV